jgi:putative VirB-like lipoprotein
MQRSLIFLVAALGVAGCAPGYTSAEVVYAEPARYTYVMPVDRVVVVTREVLVDRGWTVYRIERDGPNRIIWARHGDDEIVRIFANPHGEQVAVRGEHGDHDDRDDHGDHGKHKGWSNRGEPRDIIAEIDVRLRGRG